MIAANERELARVDELIVELAGMESVNEIREKIRADRLRLFTLLQVQRARLHKMRG